MILTVDIPTIGSGWFVKPIRIEFFIIFIRVNPSCPRKSVFYSLGDSMVSFLLCVLIAVMFPVSSAESWQLPEFMISTWGAPEAGDDDAKAAALAEAGLNTVMWPADKLDVLRKHGLRALVESATPDAAEKLKNDAVVWGYHLADEPETEQFPELARQAAAFRASDPNHPAYINLFARAGDHLACFIDTVYPQVLSYDYYQWWYGDYQAWWEGCTGYFSRLEQHRAAAKNAGIPLICWVEVTANKHDDRYKNVPLPSDSNPKVRQSVYNSLAYGVKGIQWFHGRLLFEKGSVGLNECGKHVAAINAELKRLGPILLNLESVDVFHTPPLPRGTKEAPGQYWVLPEGDDLVMGMFSDSEKHDYIMVVNRQWERGQKAALVFQRKIESVELLDRKTGEWQTLPIGIRSDREDAYNSERIEAFLGVPTRSHDRLVHLRTINSYIPPFQTVEFMLEPGDGELLKITSGKKR